MHDFGLFLYVVCMLMMNECHKSVRLFSHNTLQNKNIWKMRSRSIYSMSIRIACKCVIMMYTIMRIMSYSLRLQWFLRTMCSTAFTFKTQILSDTYHTRKKTAHCSVQFMSNFHHSDWLFFFRSVILPSVYRQNQTDCLLVKNASNQFVEETLCKIHEVLTHKQFAAWWQ